MLLIPRWQQQQEHPSILPSNQVSQVEQTMDKTGRSMNERRVAVLPMMETSEAYSLCEQHLGCGCEGERLQGQTNNGQDQQVHEREEGGRLVDDGDIGDILAV
jgi:hypothetical protein